MYGPILLILRDKHLKEFKASRLNIDEYLYKEAKINVQNKKKRLLPRKIKRKC